MQMQMPGHHRTRRTQQAQGKEESHQRERERERNTRINDPESPQILDKSLARLGLDTMAGFSEFKRKRKVNCRTSKPVARLKGRFRPRSSEASHKQANTAKPRSICCCCRLSIGRSVPTPNGGIFSSG